MRKIWRFVEVGVQAPVELECGCQVRPERLLQHDPRPPVAPAPLAQAGLAQVDRDGLIERGRQRQVDHPVAAGPGPVFERVQR